MAEPTIAKSSAVAKNCDACTGCRMSKVKCVPEHDDEASANGPCQRCTRLGLHCIFEQSKRGRGARKARDLARLGPSVRALLRTEEKVSTGSAPTTTKNEAPSLIRIDPEEECSLLAWRGNECQRMMVQSIGSREGQVALLKHWLRIGMASGHCGLLGNILILAHKCQISLDDFRLPLPFGNAVSAAPAAPPLPPPPPPPYISEWLADPSRLCCMRVQHEGVVSWQPNDGFVRHVGDEASLRQRLEAEQGSSLADEPDYLICAAEVFLAAALHKTDQRCLARLNGVLWTSVSAPQALHAATGVRSAEAAAPVDVRCALRLQQPTPATASTDGAATPYTPCQLSGRTLLYPDSRTVFSVFSLSPPAAHMGLIEGDAAAAAAPRELGFEAWPMNMHALQINGAHGLGNHGDQEEVSYDALEDLGLSFDPADLDEMVAGYQGEGGDA